MIARQSGSTRRMYSGSHASMSLPSNVRRRWMRSPAAISPQATAPSTVRPTAPSVDSSNDISKSSPPSTPLPVLSQGRRTSKRGSGGAGLLRRGLAHDAAQPVERQVGHRRGDGADPVRDEAERQPEVR